MSESSILVGGSGGCTTITCSFDGVGGSAVDDDGSGGAGVKSFSPSATVALALGVAFVVIPALVNSV